MLKKIAFGGLGLLFLASPLLASADAVSDLQAQIKLLAAQLAAIQAQKSAPVQADDYGDGSSTMNIYCPKLSITMKRAARDSTTAPKGQVSELQIFLANYFDLNEESLVTGYFGKLTEATLIRFQKALGLPAKGIAGSMTRAKIKEVCGKPRPQPGEVPGATHSMADIAQFMQSGASKKCTIRDGSESGVIYVTGGKFLMDAAMGANHMFYLVQNGIATIWTTNKNEGYQTEFPIGELARQTAKNANCIDWQPDMSLFQVPANVTIKNPYTPESLEEARRKGRDARRISDLKQLQLALELYYDTNGRYPAGFNEKGTQPPGALGVLATSGFISIVPTDPSNGTVYTYAVMNGGKGYLLAAYLEDKTSTALSYDIDGNVTTDNGVVGCDDVGGIYCVSESGPAASPSEIESKRQQVMRGMSAFEPSLINEFVKLVQKIRASTRTDIQNLRAFADKHESMIMTLQSLLTQMAGWNPVSMTAAQLDDALAKLVQAQREKQILLSAYNTLDPKELEKLETQQNSTALGLYIGYMNGSMFIQTPNITRADALANCTLNANNNPSNSVRCTWNGEEIFNRVAGQKAQVVGVYEGTYPAGVNHSYDYHPEGTINLTLTGAASVPILVLSSYEPVNWIISNPSGIAVTKVITLGYYEQRVTGLSAPIESHYYAKDGNYAWSCAYANYETGGGCSYNSLKSWLANRGFSIANFTGSYKGSSFFVNFTN